jgi:hypothetical protein
MKLLRTLVERLDDILDKYLPESHFIIGLDEAQCAARLYPIPSYHLPATEYFDQSSAK